MDVKPVVLVLLRRGLRQNWHAHDPLQHFIGELAHGTADLPSMVFQYNNYEV